MVLLAEVHQPLGGLALQVEDVQGGGGVAGGVEGSAEIGVLEHLTGGLQLIGAVHAVVDGLGGLDLLLEELGIPQLGLAARLVGQILLDLLDVRGHLLGGGDALILLAAVELDDVLEEADEGLGVHDHMVAQEVHAVEAVGQADHHNPGEGGILHLEGDSGPLLHYLVGFLQGALGEVHKLDVPLFLVHHVLVVGAVLVLGKADPHALAAVIGLVDGLLEQIPVDLGLDGQTGADVHDRRAGAIGEIEQVKFLRYGQGINRITFMFAHHLIIPPINLSRASSYSWVFL